MKRIFKRQDLTTGSRRGIIGLACCRTHGANAPTVSTVEVIIMIDKNKSRIGNAALALLLGLFLSPALQAAAHGMPRIGGYLLDSGGGFVRNDYGECWQTGSWSGDVVPAACGGPEPVMAPEPVAEKPATPPPPPVKKLVIRTIDLGYVNFAFDKSSLDDTARGKLDEMVVNLRMDDTVEGFEIVGHTDGIGEPAYNMKLSLQRANTVADYLESKGLPRDKMQVIGKGETEPRDNNATREGRAVNRRTEVWVRRRTPIEQ